MSSSQDSRPNYRPLKGMAFEDALAELESIVQRLERGSSRLDESIAVYERGEALKAHCEHLLSRAQGQVEKITRVAEQEKSGTAASKARDAEGGGDRSNKAKDAKGFVREELAASQR